MVKTSACFPLIKRLKNMLTFCVNTRSLLLHNAALGRVAGHGKVTWREVEEGVPGVD